MKTELYLKHLFDNIWKNSVINIFSAVEHLFLLQQMLDMPAILVPTKCCPFLYIMSHFPHIFFIDIGSRDIRNLLQILGEEKGEFFLNRRGGVAVSSIFLDFLLRSFRCKV